MITQILLILLASLTFAQNGFRECCDLCDVSVVPDACGYSSEFGQLSCSTGNGFCQSLTCNDCSPNLLNSGDSCSSHGQCKGSLACVQGTCQESVIETQPEAHWQDQAPIPRPQPLPQPSSSPKLIGYWNGNAEHLLTVCQQGYDVINFYSVNNFGFDYQNPAGAFTNSVQDVAACRALGVKVVLVLGGSDGSSWETGYSISGGESLARILWDTYFAAGQFDGVDFDIEGLVGSAGTGSDLAAIIHYFRQQGGQDFIISVAPYSGFQGMQDAQDVVRDGIARAASSISYLNVQTYDVYYNGIEDNGLLAENYNWYTNQYGIPVNVGINVCVHQAKATLYDMQWFTRLLNVPPAGLFLWTTDCASRNLWNGVVGLRSKDFADWVHGSFPY